MGSHIAGHNKERQNYRDNESGRNIRECVGKEVMGVRICNEKRRRIYVVKRVMVVEVPGKRWRGRLKKRMTR